MPADDLTPGQVDKPPQQDSATRQRRLRATPPHLSQQVLAKRRRHFQAARSLVPSAPVDAPAVAVIDVPAVAQELQVHRHLIQALAEELVRARDAQETSRAMLQENREVIEVLRQKLAALEMHRDNQAAQAKAGDLEALRANQARQATQLAHLKQELEASRVQHARPWWHRLFRRR